MQLVRLRRHVVKRWLLHAAPTGSWCAKLLRRLWTFTGHICRQKTFRPSQPARVMMGHLATTHAHGLARPGPWKTLHALFQKSWTSHGLEGDFLNTALDRDCWKTLEQVFVQWFHPYTPCNVELLQCSPWESPDMLLRAHVPWVHAVLVQLTEDANNNCRLAVTWLDEVDGMCALGTTCLPRTPNSTPSLRGSLTAFAPWPCYINLLSCRSLSPVPLTGRLSLPTVKQSIVSLNIALAVRGCNFFLFPRKNFGTEPFNAV